ncbi:MAG: hypothetical protein ABSE43_03440 [Steroidobacteraceae bacterium]
MLACTSASTPAATPTAAAQKYSAPDGSASVQLPAGWKVVQAANGVIQATGPQGESANLGTTLQVHNGPLQLSTTQLTLPSTASLPAKLNAMVVLGKQNPAASATGQVQNTLISQAAIKVPATVGQCGRFLFSSALQGAATTDSEAVFCSTPVNAAGNYNLIYVGATVPAAQAQQERPALEALLASFTVTTAAMQSKLTVAAAAPASGAAMAAPSAQTPAPLALSSAAAQIYEQRLQAGITNEATASILQETANMNAVGNFGANCTDDLLTNNNYNFYHTGC